MRNVPRIVTAYMLTLALVAGQVHGQNANQDRDDPIVKKLNEIQKRLDKIESRLAKLEAKTVDRWRVGERGLLLDGAGKQLGFWGIDSIIQSPVRR